MLINSVSAEVYVLSIFAAAIIGSIIGLFIGYMYTRRRIEIGQIYNPGDKTFRYVWVKKASKKEGR